MFKGLRYIFFQNQKERTQHANFNAETLRGNEARIGGRGYREPTYQQAKQIASAFEESGTKCVDHAMPILEIGSPRIISFCLFLSLRKGERVGYLTNSKSTFKAHDWIQALKEVNKCKFIDDGERWSVQDKRTVDLNCEYIKDGGAVNPFNWKSVIQALGVLTATTMDGRALEADAFLFSAAPAPTTA